MQASSLNSPRIYLTRLLAHNRALRDFSLREAALRPAFAALLGVAAAACTTQQIDRPGTWQPTGANEHNLRAMVADPRDLEAGAGAATERASGPARAVTRLLIDRRRPLLNVSLSRVAPNQEAQDAGLSGPAAGGPSAPP